MKRFILIFLVICNQVFASYEFNLLRQKNDKMYVTLRQNGQAVKFEDLKTVHDEKLHIFLISEDLEFYAHAHPQEEGNGIFSFQVHNFEKNKNYRVWGEFTKNNNLLPRYVFFDITNVRSQNIKRIYDSSFQHRALTFNLSFQSKPKVGENVNGTINITRNGRPVKILQTIMGDKAHIVFFSNGNKNISHIHPAGFSNGELKFHTRFTEKGFAKIFVQVKINDEEIIVPFGVNVN